MNCCMTLILLSFGLSLSSCSDITPRTYHYVNLRMNWSDAQQYCRQKYTDLATIASVDDLSRLQSTFSYSWAWIGLNDDPSSWKGPLGNDTNSWRWSATGETSKTGYQKWSAGEPNNEYARQKCVVMVDGEWFDLLCEAHRAFVCYTAGTNQTEKTYELISSAKTWTEARDYCRQHYTDLATIENNEENNQVCSLRPAGDVWIGLYRVPWTWSDKTQSSFRHWHRSEPDNTGCSEFCVSENTEHLWDDDPCSIKLPFICHKVTEVKTVVRLNIKTDADLTDPAVNTQILQQVAAVLMRQGLTDVTLRWTNQPEKPTPDKLNPEPDCILNF